MGDHLPALSYRDHRGLNGKSRGNLGREFAFPGWTELSSRACLRLAVFTVSAPLVRNPEKAESSSLQ